MTSSTSSALVLSPEDEVSHFKVLYQTPKGFNGRFSLLLLLFVMDMLYNRQRCQ
jgi:hypothetical protein